MGRKVCRGFRMGDTCTSMADSCQCMAKTITILESNYLSIKINKLIKKIKNIFIIFFPNVCVSEKNFKE